MTGMSDTQRFRRLLKRRKSCANKDAMSPFCCQGVVGSMSLAKCASHSLLGGAKKSKPIGLDFFICVRRTQHHLTDGQHHYELRIHHCPLADTKRCCASHKRCCGKPQMRWATPNGLHTVQTVPTRDARPPTPPTLRVCPLASPRGRAFNE